MTDGWNLPPKGGFYRPREFFMRTIVDKVMRAFTFKHPISDNDADREEAIELAAKLLENYKARLGRCALGRRRG